MSLFKHFIKNSAIYGIATMLARGVSFLLLPLYTRALSPADYGVSDVIATIISLLGIIIPMEIGQGLYRFFPEGQTEEEKIKYSSTAFWFVLGLNALFLSICLPFSTRLAEMILGSTDSVKYLIVALVTLFIYSPLNLMLLVLQSRLQAVEYGVVNLAITVFSIIVSIFAVLILRMGIMGVLLGNIVGYFSGAILAIYFAQQYFKYTFHWEQLREMISFSLPLIPSSIGYFATLYVNRFALSILLNFTEVGLFSIAYRLVSPISLIMNSLSSSLLPLVYANYRLEETPKTLARIFRLTFSACMILILLFSLFSRELLFVFTTSEYFPAATLILPLTIATVFTGMYLFTVGLVIAKKTNIIAVINITSGVLNFALNWLLIPLFGIIGSSLAACLSVLANFLISMYYSQKYYFIPVAWRQIWFSFVTTICAASLSMAITEVSVWSVSLKIFILAIVLITFFIIGSFTLIELRDFFQMIKRALKLNR